MAELWTQVIGLPHPLEAMRQKIANAKANIRDFAKSEDDRLTDITAFNDRCLEVKLSATDSKDGRVTLNVSITAFLDL